jgi:hypothetical protein
VLTLAGTVALLLSGCSVRLLSQTAVISVDNSQAGAGGDSTGQFSVPGAWDLKFNHDCSRKKSEGLPGADALDMTIYNADDDSTNSEHPEVHLTGAKAARVLHFNRGGSFYVKVDSRCDWRVQVLDRSGRT